MKPERSDRDIGAMMRDGRWVDEAIAASRRRLVREHRLMGRPLVVWRDGAVAYLPAEDFEEDAPEE
jgi:hypothetical protein